jgi:site-specific DNA-methyltransferase (adenine-specific)
VLDPFCGCATTCVAAQQLDRKWIGIDIEKQAVGILVDRLSNDAGMFKDFVNTATVPQRTDVQIIEPVKAVKERLYKEQNGLCNGCYTQFEMRNLEIDHIIPKSKGGGDYYENYQLLCGNCNRKKGDRTMEYLRMKISKKDELLKHKIIF